jgi:hypothetical protein
MTWLCILGILLLVGVIFNVFRRFVAEPWYSLAAGVALVLAIMGLMDAFGIWQSGVRFPC